MFSVCHAENFSKARTFQFNLCDCEGYSIGIHTHHTHIIYKCMSKHLRPKVNIH